MVAVDLIDEKRFPDGTFYNARLGKSSWYFLRYMDPKNDGEFCKRFIRLLGTGRFIHWWKEHATGHLLYSRFWNMF